MASLLAILGLAGVAAFLVLRPAPAAPVLTPAAVPDLAAAGLSVVLGATDAIGEALLAGEIESPEAVATGAGIGAAAAFLIPGVGWVAGAAIGGVLAAIEVQEARGVTRAAFQEIKFMLTPSELDHYNRLFADANRDPTWIRQPEWNAVDDERERLSEKYTTPGDKGGVAQFRGRAERFMTEGHKWLVTGDGAEWIAGQLA